MYNKLKAAPMAGLLSCVGLFVAAAPAYSQAGGAAAQTTAAATPATSAAPPSASPSTTPAATTATASNSTSSSSQAAGSGGELAEVTVTAQRRTETEVNVPMSMSVLSQQTLQTEEVKTFNDFATQVPNLSFNYGGSPGGTGTIGGNTDDRAVAIRGIQGGDTTGYYLDDLPLPLSVSPRVLDLSRIEVLEGPQGTLYGARSMGGTIRMITNAPDLNQFSGFVLGQGTAIDAGGDGYEFYGIFNVPLITDTLAVRITPFRGQDGGFINRKWSVTPPSPSVSYASPPTGPFDEQKNTAETEYYGVDASLLWKPLENLVVQQTNIYQSDSANGLPMGDYTANNQTNYRHFDIPEGTLDRYWINGLTIDYTIPRVGTITSASDWLNRHTGDWEDISEFTSAIWGTPLYPSPVPQFGDWHIFNQELRFASGWQFPLQFVGGLFYDNTQFTNTFSQALPQFEDIFGTTEAAFSWNLETQEEKAVFGELTYDITSRWSATLGGRYSEDVTKNNGYQWGAIVATTSPEDTVPMDTYEADKVFTPKFLVKYQANQNLDVYADAAKGFRPGGGQIPPSLIFCSAQYAALDLTPAELSTYKPDSVWSYELGEKLITDDHRYSLNSSLYWINWSHIRELLGLDCGYAALVNSGDARSIGAELQISALPIDHVTLSGGIGYDNARILHPGLLSGTSPAGTPIQEVAPLTANFMAQYQAPLTATMQWLAEGDYSYTGHSISVTTNPSGIIRPAYALENLRLELLKGGTQYAFFIKNVGDVHPNLSEGFSIGGFDPGRLRWIEGVPRTYGIEVSQRF